MAFGCKLVVGSFLAERVLYNQIGDDSMLNIGDQAPDFELPNHLDKENKVRLSDFRGKKNVVIAFYPLDWTPV